jgi:hypothetical protein
MSRGIALESYRVRSRLGMSSCKDVLANIEEKYLSSLSITPKDYLDFLSYLPSSVR